MAAEEAVLVAFAVLLGLMFGSFATAAAYRIPRKESFVTGRSKCPHCDATITAIENIPLFSYIALRGRCRHCRARISPRYPMIEVGTGILFGLSAWKFGLNAETPIYCAFFWVLVVLTIIDIEHQLLPTKLIHGGLVVCGGALVLVALLRGDSDSLMSMLYGLLLYVGIFEAIYWIAYAIYNRKGMTGFGGGDARLARLLGPLVAYAGGAGVVPVSMFLGFFFGGVLGIAHAAWAKRRRSSGKPLRHEQIPYGPYMILGAVIAIFWGQRLLDAYLDTAGF